MRDAPRRINASGQILKIPSVNSRSGRHWTRFGEDFRTRPQFRWSRQLFEDRVHTPLGNSVKPFSFRPSPVPIEPSLQRRSSFVQLQRACVCHVSEQPSPFSEPLPTVLFEQPQSSRELTRTAFEVLFLFRMTCQKRRARHQFHGVLWSTDLVPSLTTGRLRPNWSLSSTLVGDCIKAEDWRGDLRSHRHRKHSLRLRRLRRSIRATKGRPTSLPNRLWGWETL